MAIYEIKAGDTWPPVRATLEDEDGLVPLTGASIRFLMKQVNGSKVVDGLVTSVNIEESVVGYEWTDGDTDVPGVYRYEWEVTFGNGRRETFPSDGWEDLVIKDDLGGSRSAGILTTPFGAPSDP